MNGIDVCTYQGYPEWNKVKDSGIGFAMIKAGQGHAESSKSYLFQDSKFKYNIINATKFGIKCGTYYYFTATTPNEAIRQARHFISIMEPYKKFIALYAAIDVESKYLKNLTKYQLSKLVEIFCDEVEKAGYRPIVYTNPNWLIRKVESKKRPLWLALWRNKNRVPKRYKNMKIWQYGSTKVNGITNPVDSNVGYFQEILSANPNDIIETSFVDREEIKMGDKVRVENPIIFGTKRKFKVYFDKYDVISVKNSRAIIGIGKTVTAAISTEYLAKV